MRYSCRWLVYIPHYQLYLPNMWCISFKPALFIDILLRYKLDASIIVQIKLCVSFKPILFIDILLRSRTDA